MLRSTKIVATLGPASSDPAILERMVRAGVDVVRLNFSHGSADDHRARAQLVKDISRKTGRTVAIMCDLQGPKIRVGKFKDGRVTLEKGAPFILDANCTLGDAGTRGLDYKELPRDVEAGAVLLLDDGRISLEVTEVHGSEVHTVVRQGGVLSNNKGINRQGGGLTAPALTPKDMEDIRTAAEAAGRLSRGVVPEIRRRHVHGAGADARRGRQGLADRKDRARRSGQGGRADRHHECLRRDHGGARRSRGRGGRCLGARAAEDDDPARRASRTSSRSPRRR